jgi:hypothetical protein
VREVFGAPILFQARDNVLYFLLAGEGGYEERVARLRDCEDLGTEHHY